MKSFRVFAAAAVVMVGAIGACSSEAGADSTEANDVVLRGKDYTEYFKDEGDGKNYLYTRTEWDDQAGNHCVVVTGHSESTVAIACTPKSRG